MYSFKTVVDSAIQQTALPTRAHPATAYREYLRCVRGRDLKRVFELTCDDSREAFESMSSERDFWPLFDLWCESQSMDIRIDACFVKGDVAILDIRETRVRFRVELRYVAGTWKVCSETRIGIEKRRAAALVAI